MKSHQLLLRGRSGADEVVRSGHEHGGRVDEAAVLAPEPGDAVPVHEEGLGHQGDLDGERRDDQGQDRRGVEFLEGSAGEEVLEADGPAGRLARNRLLDPVRGMLEGESAAVDPGLELILLVDDAVVDHDRSNEAKAGVVE
jgi:hypothetical protein